MSKGRTKYPTFNDIYSLGKKQFTIKYLQVIFPTFILATLICFRFSGSLIHMEDIGDIMCY